MRHFLLICLFFSGTCSLQAQYLTVSDTTTLRIKITDTQNRPIFGVYVINKNKSFLITSSDIDGECIIHNRLLHPNDSIQFQGMGYKLVTYTPAALQKIDRIQLEELSYQLEETIVQSISTEELLNKVSAKLKKLPRSTLPYCNFYGNAQYEKITNYRDTTLEYRREYGYYFTSGDIRPKNTWDQSFRSYFLPVYTQRSYNLTNNGSDTLSPLYITTEDNRFDAGTRKIFTLLRAVQLYGPLFSGTHTYEFKPVDTDSLDYVYSFHTRSQDYPDQTRISCKGTLVIDFHRHILKRMTFEYIDYQLLRQVLLTNRRKTSSPYSTRADLTFGYDKNNQIYIRSCQTTTQWKYDLGNDFLVLEQPSRMLPSAGNLIEKEAFCCYDYKPVKKEFRTHSVAVKIHVAQRNPLGTYDSLLFSRLPLLLEKGRSFDDLNRYADIEQQFQRNNNKTYYPDNFLNGFNGFLGVGRDDKAFRENTYQVRKKILELFGTPALPDQITGQK